MTAWESLAPKGSAAETIARTAALPAVARAFAWLNASPEECVAETVAIAQIPAPTFHEGQRSTHVAERLRALGAADVDVFGGGNAIGRFGPDDGPGVALLAHLDTVFAANLDHTVRRDGGRLYGPGVGDNSIGVGGTLTAFAAAMAAGVEFARPVWVVGNVGEEGLGDLRGARETVDRLGDRLGAVLAVEGTMLGRLGHVAVGSRRLRVRFSGAGGHSWLDFGQASAVHAAVGAAAEIARLDVPTDPRTTYNIGRIEGGDGVNVIAPTAEFVLDLRSTAPPALDALDARVAAILSGATATQDGRISVDVQEVGNRPAGQIARHHPLVDLSAAALERVGVRPEPTAGSTDANIPLSRGIPALAVGITRGGGIHSAGEWVEVAPALQGVQHLLLLCAALAGVRA